MFVIEIKINSGEGIATKKKKLLQLKFLFHICEKFYFNNSHNANIIVNKINIQ